MFLGIQNRFVFSVILSVLCIFSAQIACLAEEKSDGDAVQQELAAPLKSDEVAIKIEEMIVKFNDELEKVNIAFSGGDDEQYKQFIAFMDGVYNKQELAPDVEKKGFSQIFGMALVKQDDKQYLRFYKKENQPLFIMKNGKNSFYQLAKDSETTLHKSDQLEYLSNSPTIVNSRTFLPLRSLSQVMGKHVVYDSREGKIIIGNEWGKYDNNYLINLDPNTGDILGDPPIPDQAQLEVIKNLMNDFADNISKLNLDWMEDDQLAQTMNKLEKTEYQGQLLFEKTFCLAFAQQGEGDAYRFYPILENDDQVIVLKNNSTGTGYVLDGQEESSRSIDYHNFNGRNYLPFRMFAQDLFNKAVWWDNGSATIFMGDKWDLLGDTFLWRMGDNFVDSQKTEDIRATQHVQEILKYTEPLSKVYTGNVNSNTMNSSSVVKINDKIYHMDSYKYRSVNYCNDKLYFLEDFVLMVGDIEIDQGNQVRLINKEKINVGDASGEFFRELVVIGDRICAVNILNKGDLLGQLVVMNLDGHILKRIGRIGEGDGRLGSIINLTNIEDVLYYSDMDKSSINKLELIKLREGYGSSDEPIPVVEGVNIDFMCILDSNRLIYSDQDKDYALFYHDSGKTTMVVDNNNHPIKNILYMNKNSNGNILYYSKTTNADVVFSLLVNDIGGKINEGKTPTGGNSVSRLAVIDDTIYFATLGDDTAQVFRSESQGLYTQLTDGEIKE